MPLLLEIAQGVRSSGVHTEIVEIEAPDSAVVGDRVGVLVKVKNLNPATIPIHTVVTFDTEAFIDQGALVASGAIQGFAGLFTMPGMDVTIHAYTYYEGSLDDEAEKLISVEEAIPPPGWTKLDTRIITLTPTEAPVGWVKLDTRIITLTPTEAPVGWVKLDTRIITLTPTEAPPIPPEYKLVFSHEYPLGKTYAGKASEGTSTFTISLPEQLLFPHGWLMDIIASTFEGKVEEQGERMLDLKIYEDATPMFQTHYIIKSVCTTHSPFPWAIVIIGILAIILVVVIKNLVTTAKDIDWEKLAFPMWAVLLGIGAVVGTTILLTRKRKKG